MYQEQFALLQEAERERIFCRHTLEHFLDVARMMYIFYLEDREAYLKKTACFLLDMCGGGKAAAGEQPKDAEKVWENENQKVLSEKEMIYAAALLHDIGRYQQICGGIPHDEASAAYARKLLPECGFSEEEIAVICDAILHHRGEKSLRNSIPLEGKMNPADRLSEYLYRADKLSRCCFVCPAQTDCNWSEEKKNHQIIL